MNDPKRKLPFCEHGGAPIRRRAGQIPPAAGQIPLAEGQIRRRIEQKGHSHAYEPLRNSEFLGKPKDILRHGRLP